MPSFCAKPPTAPPDFADLGLFAFAVYNIVLLFRYEFFLQSSENTATEANPFVEFPDIILCTTNSYVYKPAMSWFTDNEFTKSLQGPNVTLIAHTVKDINNGPCNIKHDLLTVVTLNGEKVNRTKYSHLYIPLSMNPFSFGRSNDSLTPAYIIAMPHENNPYVNNRSAWPLGFEESRDVVENLYATPNTKQEARIRTTITKTWRRRKDFIGLWGYFEDQPTYSAATQFITYSSVNQTADFSLIQAYVPTTSFENSQVLIQTFQSAFSSWGGAFGVAWGFFYFLFGSPRMDPFGFFALYILGRSTKRILEERYFAEKKDSSNLKNDHHNNSSSDHPSTTTKVSSRRDLSSKSAFLHDYNQHDNDLEAQQQHKKDQKYRDLEARIVSLEAVLDDFYLDLSPFRKEKEEEDSQKSSSWYRRTFSSKTNKAKKDEKDAMFVQIEDRGRKTSYESENYRMGQMQRDHRSA
ncbi:hypothetical protein KVV02_000878 [Mortierella alpina]|uniref:Uncharacterized protein n=1 Tax=Mortierella alpina TaxID=64518 RepID=A0A9P8D296_MORAP|nr:hypothetical protein KVV02_000878 [Mortierella alpina]